MNRRAGYAAYSRKILGDAPTGRCFSAYALALPLFRMATTGTFRRRNPNAASRGHPGVDAPDRRDQTTTTSTAMTALHAERSGAHEPTAADPPAACTLGVAFHLSVWAPWRYRAGQLDITGLRAPETGVSRRTRTEMWEDDIVPSRRRTDLGSYGQRELGLLASIEGTKLKGGGGLFVRLTVKINRNPARVCRCNALSPDSASHFVSRR